MFLHELSDDLVLALELGFKHHDMAVLDVQSPLLGALKRDSAVVEELPLPFVKQRGSDVTLVADVRD